MATWISLAVGLLALGGALGSVWLTQRNANHREDIRWDREREREQARWAHEEAARSDERTQQRGADSYLEVLRIVEREGQRVQASITTWRTLDEELPPEPEPPSRGEVEQAGEQMRARMRESAADQVTIAAQLGVFGTVNARKLYDRWRSVITEIENEEEELHWRCGEYWPGGRADTPPGALKPMLAGLEALQPKEDAARQALANAMAEELGHR